MSGWEIFLYATPSTSCVCFFNVAKSQDGVCCISPCPTFCVCVTMRLCLLQFEIHAKNFRAHLNITNKLLMPWRSSNNLQIRRRRDKIRERAFIFRKIPNNPNGIDDVRRPVAGMAPPNVCVSKF